MTGASVARGQVRARALAPAFALELAPAFAPERVPERAPAFARNRTQTAPSLRRTARSPTIVARG